MKSVSGIIIIIKKYLPLLPARFCQIQESISIWFPNETLIDSHMHVCVRACVHAHTHTSTGIFVVDNKRSHFHLGKGLSYF